MNISHNSEVVARCFLSLSFILASLLSYADEIWVDSATGHTWSYLSNGNNTLTITGVSPAEGNIEIPVVIGGMTVVDIGDRAFYECSELTGVKIPDGVKSVGNLAFHKCYGLTNVTIGVGVTNIARYAFCLSGLTRVAMPYGVLKIDQSAFSSCSNLTSVVIPNSVTEIGGYAFSTCTSLKEMVIPSSVTRMGWGVGGSGIGAHSVLYGAVFKGCSELTSVVLSDGVHEIAKSMFEGCCNLTNVVMPSVTSIGERAFNGCSRLPSMVTPNGVREIGNAAFEGCSSLTNIVIASSVTNIGERAFSGCGRLKSVVFPQGLLDIKMFAFSGCGELEEIVIPDSVVHIGQCAFEYCGGVTNLVIGQNVTNLDARAFWECTGLTSVEIPGCVDQLDSTFQRCSGLTNVIICSGLRIIAHDAFCMCSGLTSIVIPESVTSIGHDAFWGCPLKGVRLLGDAPECEDAWLNSVYVSRGSKGWDGDPNSTALPETWHGWPIRYFSIEHADVILSGTTFEYCGMAIRPIVLEVKLLDSVFGEDVDYKVSYSNNINAGTASAVLTGMGEFNGEQAIVHFTITPKMLTAAMVGAVGNVTYTGSAFTPEPAITDAERGVTLVKGMDYTLSYSNNKNAGTATVTVTGKGNYTGSISKTFTISKANYDMSGATWSYSSPFTYDGQAHSVTLSGLPSGVTVKSYSNNSKTAAGSYTATATFNYDSTNYNAPSVPECAWSISRRDITDASVTLGTALTYNGQLQGQSVSGVTAGGLAVTYTVSGNTATDAGNYTLTVTGTGNFTGTATKQFTIARKPIAGATVTLAGGLTYTGSAQSQGVSAVTIGGLNATFDVSGNSATAAGNYTLTVTGTGNFTGSTTKQFTVAPKPLTAAMVGAVGNVTYTGSAFTPEPVVTDSERGVTLVKGTDYTLSYANNKNAGTATVTVAGKGNYTGTIPVNFTIAKQTIQPPTIAGKTYTGQLQTATVPSSTLYDIVQNAGGVDVGLYDVKLRLVDSSNYAWSGASGTDMIVKFAITKATNAWIAEPSIASWTYGQTASVPNMGAAKFGTAIVTYSAPLQNAGSYTATFTVPGTSNYDGLLEPVGFSIMRKSIAGATMTLGPALVFTGAEQSQTVESVKIDGLTATYTVSGNKATDAGTYTLTVTGTGNYTGFATAQWQIRPDGIVESVASYDGIYDGEGHGIAVTVTKPDGAVVKYAYAVSGPYSEDAILFTNVTEGAIAVWYTVEAENYTTVTNCGTVKISPKALTDAMVAVEDVAYTYDGTVKEPAVTVSDGEPSILAESDYDVAYSDNTNAGTDTATVTVTGKGNYTGTVTKYFTIAKAEVTPPTSVASKAYTGGLLKADVSATARYTVQNDGGVNAGNYPVTLTLTDAANYRWAGGDSNPLALTFTITQAANEWIDEPSILGWTYGQMPNAPNLGAAKFGTVTVTYSAPPQSVGTYTATFTVSETANYAGLTKDVTFKIASAEAEKLQEIFDDLPATVESDGAGGWKVTITNDIDSADLPIEIPDNLGHVTIDLGGHDLVGPDGAAGDSSTPGGDGTPAIRIVPGAGDGDATRLFIVTTGGDSKVKGGDGGAGNPGGDGAPAVEVADGAKSGVKVDIGAGITVQGGAGGEAVGDGASPGEDSPAIVGGEIGTNDGTLVKVKVPVPVIPDAEYTGSEVSPPVPESPLYTATPSSGTQPGAYPVILTLSDAASYEWIPRDGATIIGAIATTAFTILEPPPKIVIDDGGESGAANAASYSGVYDGEGHGIGVKVTNPATGWTVRYAASAEGPFAEARPLFTNAVALAQTWYEVTAEGFDPVTNMATVTITPRSIANADLGAIHFDDVGGVRTPVPTLVDDLGREIPASNITFTWTEEASGAMTLSFTGCGNYMGLLEKHLAQTRFSVKFDFGGGVGDSAGSDADYDLGTYYGVLPTPSKAGYVFDGWYENPDFSGSPVTRNTEVIAADLTLYAKWLRRRLVYTPTVFHIEAASEWSGYVLGYGDAVAGSILVKASKPGKDGTVKLTVTAEIAGESKATLKAVTFDGRVEGTLGGRALSMSLGANSLSGTLGGWMIDGARNMFSAKDADSKLTAAQTRKRWQGTYIVAWQAAGGAPYNALSIDIKAKGKASVSGTLADGTKLSTKSQLLVGERECSLSVSWTKRGASVACLVWFKEDGTVECGNLPGGAVAKIANLRSGATLAAGSKFRIDAGAVAAKVPGALAGLLPDGVDVRMKGVKFDLDKAGKVKLLNGGVDPAGLGSNPSGLKLSYTVKNGTFKGTFTIHAIQGGKLKKVKADVSGVVLGGRGYGTASVKKVGAWPVTIE